MDADDKDKTLVDEAKADIMFQLLNLNILAEFSNRHGLSNERAVNNYKKLQELFTPDLVESVLSFGDTDLNKRLSDTYNLATYLEKTRIGSLVSNQQNFPDLYLILEQGVYPINYFQDFEKENRIRLPHDGGYTMLKGQEPQDIFSFLYPEHQKIN